MLEVGWSEMLVIAVILIVVVGPKDLPGMLRSFGRTTAKLRQMAGDFQKQFNDALQEAELDEVKKSVDALRDMNPATAIKKQLNPFEQAASDVRAGLQSLNPASAPKPASAEAQPAESPKPAPVETPAVAPAVAEVAQPPAKAEASAKTAEKAAPKAAAKPAEKTAPKASRNKA